MWIERLKHLKNSLGQHTQVIFHTMPRHHVHSLKYNTSCVDPLLWVRKPPQCRSHLLSLRLHSTLTSNKDYYKILGISNRATQDEIKAAYRKLALQWHPDRHQSNGSQKSKEMFCQIAEAYSVLGDKKKRDHYDKIRNQPQGPQTPYETSTGHTPQQRHTVYGSPYFYDVSGNNVRSVMDDIFEEFFTDYDSHRLWNKSSLNDTTHFSFTSFSDPFNFSDVIFSYDFIQCNTTSPSFKDKLAFKQRNSPASSFPSEKEPFNAYWSRPHDTPRAKTVQDKSTKDHASPLYSSSASASLHTVDPTWATLLVPQYLQKLLGWMTSTLDAASQTKGVPHHLAIGSFFKAALLTLFHYRWNKSSAPFLRQFCHPTINHGLSYSIKTFFKSVSDKMFSIFNLPFQWSTFGLLSSSIAAFVFLPYLTSKKPSE